MRRGAASCRAVLRSCSVAAAVRAAAAGIVTAEPSWVGRGPQTRQPDRGLGQPAGGCRGHGRGRGRGRRGCPDAGHAVCRPVRVLCPPGGRPSTGRADVRCPRDRCPRDRCPRDRRDPGVRTDTPPVSAASASALSTLCWILEWVSAAGRPTLCTHRVRRVAVVRERLVVAVRTGLAGRGGRVSAPRGSCECRRQTRAATSYPQAAAPRSPPGRPGSWSSARGPVAGWGAREGVGAHKSPRRCVLRGLPPSRPDMGWTRSGDHPAWSWSWCWSRVVQLRRPIRFGGGAACGRSAAAVRERR
jgi:hypothetical protein